VNCRKTPIERIVPEGIQTSDGKIHEVDVIVLAVGFDAGSGALSRIDIRGRDGRSLKDKCTTISRTAMGLQVARLSQPVHHRRAARSFRSAVQHDDLPAAAGRLDHRLHRLCAGERQERRRSDQGVRGQLGEAHDETAGPRPSLSKPTHWYMGSNVGGKPRRLLAYIGGVGNYNQQCDALAANGYQGFSMT